MRIYICYALLTRDFAYDFACDFACGVWVVTNDETDHLFT